jgi:periplasmic divalent cation tolerance protein
MDEAMLVITNFPNLETAQQSAQELVELKLAACVNLFNPVQSIYRWQGKIEQAEEVSLHIKTTKNNLTKIEQVIIKNHPYDVPEIIALKIENGYVPYLQWIAKESTQN